MPRLAYIFWILIFVGLLPGCTTTTDGAFGGANYKKAAEANARLGVGYMAQGNFELAKVKLDKALRYDEENVKANHYMGELYRRLGEMQIADKYFRRALDLDKEKNTDLLNNYGVFLCEMDKYQDAEKYFKEVLEDPFHKKRSSVYENLGLCAKRKGDLRKAEHNFNKALLMNPRLPKSLLEMVTLNYDRGDADSAYNFYKRYLKFSKQNAESLWLGVLLETKRGNRNTASSYALRLKNQFPRSKESRLATRYLEERKRR